ncbi:MarC family protein [Aestuariibius insulae]|uniref:MarC family protein n=1 Tax=Aestuariibius insulae TaxID=2058287 RepID=UPI00345E1A01
MELAFLVTAFTALFVVIDPIGLAPVFAALTQGLSPAQRRKIAARACAVATGILLIFAFLGEAVLEFLGISMPAFRISGGILLFLTALDMLFERRQTRRQSQGDAPEEETGQDPSVFPIAIPLIAGPGSIATIILLVGEATTTLDAMLVVAIMLVTVGLVFVLFLVAGYLERLLGKVGINVVTRLLGMLLAALSVQFVLDGLASFGLGGS